jgi:hypothetical protein
MPKNKKQQTFNVYPYLGGYKHFMRNGGSLPKFVNEGEVADPETVATRIKPHNKYKYANTFDGVVNEWRANNDPNYIPAGSLMGQVAEGAQALGNFGKTFLGAFNKDNYKPGGRYSKFQTKQIPGSCIDNTGKPVLDNNTQITTTEACTNAGGTWKNSTEVFDGLKYGKTTLTNTTDQERIFHGDNLNKWMSMSKKEQQEFIDQGGQAEDLLWTAQEMANGKWNNMNKNPGSCSDGKSKNEEQCIKSGGLWTNASSTWDGINYRASVLRGNALEAQTGDRMFSNKTRITNPDGTSSFVYLDEKGNVLDNQQGNYKYDELEEGTGPGGLADANASQLHIQYEVDENGNPVDPSNNQPVSFDQQGVNQDGTPGDFVENRVYDRDGNYGNYVGTNTQINTDNQLQINCETGQTCPSGAFGVWQDGQCNCTARYGTELYKKNDNLRRFIYGGNLPRFQEGQETDGYDGGMLPEVDVNDNARRSWNCNNGNCVEVPFPQIGQYNSLEMCENSCSVDQPTGSPLEPNMTPLERRPIQPLQTPGYPTDDLQKAGPMPENNPYNVKFDEEDSKNWNAGLGQKYEELGMSNPHEKQTKGTKDEIANLTGAVNTSYGDGPLQKVWNKGRETLNTGVLGAAQDLLIGGKKEQSCSDPQYTDKASCEENKGTWTETKGTGLVDILFDNVMPIGQNIMNQNAQHKNELYKRSSSAEDRYAANESGVGSGQRGFYDVNKGGYGDDLYGTGEIFGQIAQEGMEMQQQAPIDYSEALAYMNQENGLRFNIEELKKQKNYLGKLSYGGHLPMAQDGWDGWIKKAKTATSDVYNKAKNVYNNSSTNVKKVIDTTKDLVTTGIEEGIQNRISPILGSTATATLGVGAGATELLKGNFNLQDNISNNSNKNKTEIKQDVDKMYKGVYGQGFYGSAKKHGGAHTTADINDLSPYGNNTVPYDQASWLAKFNHGFSPAMYNRRTTHGTAPGAGIINKLDKTWEIAKGATNYVKNNWLQKGGEHTAEEKVVNIDMDLYYELMNAGADIKIIR